MLVSMTSRIGVLLACILTFAACGKKQDKVAENKATGSAEAKTEEVAAAQPDPWAAPPEEANMKFGAQLGDELSKLDPSSDDAGGSGRLSQMAKKIEAGQITKPVASGVELKAFGNIETTGFSLTYNPSKDATHEQYRTVLQDNKIFESVVEKLNKTVRLPRTVDIQLVDCGTINAFYDPNSSRIIMCYELLDYFLSVFKGNVKNDEELGNAVIGATMFSFFHETGHGLIHQLDLPAVGREEDSADQLATIILIAGGDGGVSMALSGAYWFHLQSTKSEHQTPFWDEHAFDGQRFYNIMCLIYGSDPSKYGDFVTNGSLPADRAKRCPEEFAKIKKSWQKLLEPHMTNGAALNMDYQASVPVAEAPKDTSTPSDPWADTPATPSAPTPPTAPVAPTEPAPAPGGHTITCEQVATKAAELIAVEAQLQAKKMSADEVEALKAKLEAELPAVIETILAECAKANWSDDSRRCVLRSTSLADAGKCQ